MTFLPLKPQITLQYTLMTKLAFYWHLLAFALFFAGTSLALIENGSELSLLLCIAGSVLFLCLQSLAWLGQAKLSLSQPSPPKGWIILGLMVLASGLAFTAFTMRFFLNRPAFLLTISLALVTGTIALVGFLLKIFRAKRDYYE